MAYSGKYKVKNPDKYVGDVTKVEFRSLWERGLMKWLDHNTDIISWNSEEVRIPYVCGTDNRVHTYIIDFWILTKTGKSILIEVKPDVQTKPPTIPERTPSGRKSRRYLNESFKYIKNQSKWIAATKYAEQNGMEFKVWTEHTLRSLGIKIARK